VPAHRRVLEAVLTLLHTGDWMARAWERFPGSTAVRLVHHRLALLPAGMPSLRIAFLSDIHIGPTTPPRLLDNAFGLVAASVPDVVVLGGDYVYLSATAAKVDELRRRVAALDAPVKIGVSGNHDLWTDVDAVESALSAGGVEVLTNRALRLPAPHDGVAFVGLDEPTFGRPDPSAAVASCGGARVRLGVCHSPDGLPLLRDAGLAILLCGHTHGGHVATPWGAPYVPGRVGRRHPHGLHRVDGLHLFVSRGVGGVTVPFRTWAPPDVAILELVADGE